MTESILSLKAGISSLSGHDASVVLVEDGEILFGIEQERITREKHGNDKFPYETVDHVLTETGRELADIDRVVLPYDPNESRDRMLCELDAIERLDAPTAEKRRACSESFDHYEQFRFDLEDDVREALSEFDSAVPPIETVGHHWAHAVSAYYPAGMDDAVVLTLDGAGERVATGIWHGRADELERIETFDFPNSLGFFYGVVTSYLGYRMLNGEGKTMGLAPYGTYNEEVVSKLGNVIDVGPEYDVTAITRGGRYDVEYCVSKLEEILGRPRNRVEGEFDQWYKDVAYATQHFLEEIVLSLVGKYVRELDCCNVCLSGGIALNCKMNKSIIEHESVESVFIQPISNDAGVALGAAMGAFERENFNDFDTVYFGTEYSDEHVVELVDASKLSYWTSSDVARDVAELLADGNIVGWFQGRSEMGPRALGNRSILADPRTERSRARVNEHVKHRERWRPFAPSFLAEEAGTYLKTDSEYPFMIRASDVYQESVDDLAAVIHQGDQTTRPQTVRQEQNPLYYRLISEFESITGVPAVLNTSFNDHGEPIVDSPRQAIRDFVSMGLDALVIHDVILEK